MMKSLTTALMFFSLVLSACSTGAKKTDEKPAIPSVEEAMRIQAEREKKIAMGASTADAAEATAPGGSSEPSSGEASVTMLHKAHGATTVVAGPDHATPHFKTHTGVEPTKALGWLKNGNTRFVKGYVRRDGQSKKDIARLVKGQQPHTIILSCSDSRVPPEVVFDQKLGEVFTIRTAGEALDDNVIASIEYAIEHLGTRLVLVMGHTSCGAVKAAVGTLKGGDTGTPALNALVADLHPRLQAFVDKEPSSDLAAESMANAEGVVSDLVKRSALIREAFDGGDVEIRPALYHLDSGVVTIK